MIVRHVALVKWKKTATEEQIRVAQKAFPGFVPHMPGLVRFHVAPNLDTKSKSEATWDFGYVADFKDSDSFKAYQADPMHTEYGIKYVHAAREDSRRVQFDCPSNTGGAPKTVYRRLGVLKWKAGATPSQITSASGAIVDVLKNAAGMLRVAAGPNLEIDIRPDLNWDFAVTADFESMDAFNVYRDSRAHIEASQRYVVPVLEGAHNVICEWPF